MEQHSLKMLNSSKMLTDLFYNIIKDDVMRRYIEYLYTSKHPLDKTLADVPMRNIRSEVEFTPIRPNIVEKEKVYLFFWSPRHSFSADAIGIDTYLFQIAVPHRYQVIETYDTTELRSEEISRRIIRSVDQKHITGVGDVLVTGVETDKLNDKFLITTVTIQCMSGSLKDFVQN